MAAFDGTGKTNLIAAFVKAQKAFDVPKRTKTANAGKYTYRYSTLEDLIAATRKALSDNGLAVFNNVTMPGSNVVHVTAVMVHESGESHETDPYIFEVDGTPHAVGAASTYGRRYSQSALLGVAAEDDTDAAEKGEAAQGNDQGTRGVGGKRPAPKADTTASDPAPMDPAEAEQPITEAQVTRLRRMAKAAGIDAARMKAWLVSLGISESKAIKRGQYQNIVTVVQSGKVPEKPSAETA